MKKYFPGLIAALLVGGAVIAQDQVQMQGRDSTDVVRVVLVDSSGRLLTTARPNSAPTAAAHFQDSAMRSNTSRPARRKTNPGISPSTGLPVRCVSQSSPG